MCYSLWYNAPTVLPAGGRVHYTTSCNTQSGASEDGRDQRPKHVELIGIINKSLLLHVVGVCIIYINDARSSKYQIKKYILYKKRSLERSETPVLYRIRKVPKG